MSQQPAILFPSVVAALIEYFTDELAPIKAVKNIPNPRPAKFVRFFRTGGPRDDTLVTESAQVTVEVWADDDADAEDLAHLVRAHLQSLGGTTTNGVRIYRVTEFAGPQEFADTASHQSRWTWTVAVQLRGEPLTTGS